MDEHHHPSEGHQLPDEHHAITHTDLGYMLIVTWTGVDHMYGVPGVETQLQELIGIYPTMDEAMAKHDEVCFDPPGSDCLIVVGG